MPGATPTKARSVSGDLTQASFVVPPGWKPTATDTSVQGLTPNGVPAHARNPAEVTEVMLSPCGEAPAHPVSDPAHALEMNLMRGSSAGVGELLEFGTANQARAWFDAFRTQLTACVRSQPSVFTKLAATPSVWRGRRNLGSTGNFAEVGVLGGQRIAIYALDDPRHTVDTVALAARIAKG